MGGIAFEIPETIPQSQKFLPSHRKETWFLNERLINLLLKLDTGRDVLPDLSEQEIKSKSKANGIAKSLVCFQALWFITQCITRRTHKVVNIRGKLNNIPVVAQRTPISLLELNTFGHAVCTLLIYLLWWEKPFEAEYPTMIEGQILWDVRALFWMYRNVSPAVASFGHHLRTWLEDDEWFHTLSQV